MLAEEVTNKKLKEAIGKKVEVLAFGIDYIGILKKVDVQGGMIRIEDKNDYVVLEIERIESFQVLDR